MKKLLKIFIPLAVAGLFTCVTAQAQSVTTESISFKLEDVTDPYMPPDLRVNIEFFDTNNDRYLEAEETAHLKLHIRNLGSRADKVTVSVKPESTNNGVTLENSVFTSSIEKNGDWTLYVNMKANLNVPNSVAKFRINISEPTGTAIEPVVLVETLAYKKAKLNIAGVEISDSGYGASPYNGNPDNKLQNMDVAIATVKIQNIGQGQASNITYEVTASDSNIRLLNVYGPVNKISGSLKDLLVGQVSDEITFRISPNAHYVHKGGYLPVYLTIHEDRGFGDIISKQIPIPFNAAAVEPNIVKIEGDLDKYKASAQTQVYSDDYRVNNGVIKNIRTVPNGRAIYQNAVAVAIGLEHFDDKTLPPAPFADRDAEVMTEYFKKSLKISNVTTFINEKATRSEFKKLFDPQKGSLAYSIVPGETDLYVYYSGHGALVKTPEGEMDVMLIPYDVGKDWITEDGYSLNKLYKELAQLKARSVTVILDACYTGSRLSESQKSQSLTNQKYVIYDSADMEQPWLNNPNFRVLTSSRGDQTSQASDRTHSGWFTYYLAVGLQGDADKDNNGKITMAELVEFVQDNVHKETKGQQTPQFYGNSDFVVEVIK